MSGRKQKMGRRQRLVSRSILNAIFHDNDGRKRGRLARILAFFSLFSLQLVRYKTELFRKLRAEVWILDENEYKESFRKADKKGTLIAVGDLGYSGSTFLTTPNSKFLIKSLPRRFEYDFFKNKLLAPYTTHMHTYPDSLLVRITDLLHSPAISIGRLFGTAPSHHIIMENILYGKEAASRPKEWETYDLKPIDYFYPERDIAGGALAPESVKDRLVDKFNDKILVTAAQHSELLGILEADTALLEAANVVDYSLFVVRYPAASEPAPSLKSRTSPWRSGMKSSDGKWVYRAVLLDFFWAKDALQAKAMTGLIKGYNFFDRKGPMSITTTPDEYRKRFLGMVESITEVEEGSSS